MSIKQLIRYNWIYQEDNLEKYFPFKITPPESELRRIPTSLFKYYALSERSIEAIETQYLYAPHPYQLNDLYDCHESLIEFDSEQIVKEFFKGAIPTVEIEKGFLERDKEFFKKIQFNFNVLVYSKWGLLSFTEDHLSIPMWSYYTMNKGFVIEFDFSKFDFSYHGPFQVNYQESIKPVSVNNGLPLCVLYQTNVKTKHWEHEREWRMLAEKYCFMEMPGIPIPSDNIKFTDRKFKYNLTAIKRIILGNRFFHNNDKELIDNKDGTFQIELKHDIGLKGRLLKLIIENKISTYIILRNSDKFVLSEAPIVIEDDGKIDKRYILPIRK